VLRAVLRGKGGAHLTELGRGLSHAPSGSACGAAAKAAALCQHLTCGLLVRTAVQSICKCDCTIPNCGACTHKAKASQAYTGSNQAHCTARLSAGLGNGPLGAPSGLNPARPPERPEHLFRAVCALQTVVCTAGCATVVKKIDWSRLVNCVPL